MKKSLKKHILFLGIVLFNTHFLLAQLKDRPSLAEIEIQKIFIDANKEKMLGHYQDAAFLFREVLKKDPKNHSAAYELARMYDVLEQDALALKTIEKAVKLAPKNPWYMDFYGQVLERNNKFEEAANVYGTLAKAHPENEYFLFQQAFYLIKAEKLAPAVVVYDKLEKMMGVNEELTKKKYTLYYKMGDNKSAINEIQKLIKPFPTETRYLHILADFYVNDENIKEANKTYKKILSIDPKDAEANLALADSYHENGEHIKYLNAIKPIITKTDVGIDVKVEKLFPYIEILGKTKNGELKLAALELGESLTDVHPQEAKAFSLYADMLYHSGNSKEALKYYQSTLEFDKSVFAVWEQIMYIHAENNDVNDLIKTTEKAMDLFPNHAKVYYMNGLAQSSKGEHKEAISMYEQSLMMAGKNTPLKYELCNRLGIEYFNIEKYDRSDKMFDRGLELIPDGFSILHNYSYHLAQRNKDLEKARDMSIKANALKADQPVFQSNLAYIFFLLDDMKDARDWIERSMSNGGDKIPEILELYGDIQYKSGLKSKALEYWKMAKQAGAKSKELEQKISEQKL